MNSPNVLRLPLEAAQWWDVPRQVAQTIIHTNQYTGCRRREHSVTTILRAGKDPKTLQVRTPNRSGLPRGTHVHS